VKPIHVESIESKRVIIKFLKDGLNSVQILIIKCLNRVFKLIILVGDPVNTFPEYEGKRLLI